MTDLKSLSPEQRAPFQSIWLIDPKHRTKCDAPMMAHLPEVKMIIAACNEKVPIIVTMKQDAARAINIFCSSTGQDFIEVFNACRIFMISNN